MTRIARQGALPLLLVEMWWRTWAALAAARHILVSAFNYQPVALREALEVLCSFPSCSVGSVPGGSPRRCYHTDAPPHNGPWLLVGSEFGRDLLGSRVWCGRAARAGGRL